jgi:DNA modification methylase
MSDVKLIEGDATTSMLSLLVEGVTVDGCLTDPPYYLESIVKRFGNNQAQAKHGQDGRFSRLSEGFRGRQWDTDQDGYRIAHDPRFWRLVKRLIKPGGFCFAFSSPKTGHRQAVAMEDAGFIIHPFIVWLYGTGWPKAHAVTKFAPDATEWEGWYYSTQTLKPAIEPIYVGQVPTEQKSGYQNVLKHGTGAFNIDACRVGDQQRWPANFIHDESDCATGLIPGNASEFFNSFPVANYHAKATKEDRAGSKHPSVKPVGLLRHLLKLFVPKGGTVLDPFAGTGTTGQAALDESINAILIERENDYAATIRKRLDSAESSLSREAIRRLI